MSVKASELTGIIQKWLEEFSRSVEMFTGKHVELSAAALQGPPASAGSVVWRSQKIHIGGAEIGIWTGAADSTLTALNSDGGDSAESYSDIVSQANQGFACVLGNGYGIDVQCGDASGSAPAPALPLAYFSVATRVEGVESAPFLVAVSPEILTTLEAPARQLAEASSTALATSDPRQPMLERLMDLELPLSVSLGRATLPIRDVLKLTSGSLVELDRTAADYVDLVVHGTIVARGEVVSVKGNYGVRVREIISREDRMALHARA